MHEEALYEEEAICQCLLDAAGSSLGSSLVPSGDIERMDDVVECELEAVDMRVHEVGNPSVTTDFISTLPYEVCLPFTFRV